MKCLFIVLKNVAWMLALGAVLGIELGAMAATFLAIKHFDGPDLIAIPVSLLVALGAFGAATGIYECRARHL